MLGLHHVIGLATALQSGGGIIPRGSRAEVFNRIYWVFLLLGTIVGVVVISYMLYNAYKYRAGAGNGKSKDAERPELGELPRGGGGGRKLFLSFGLSAVVVISLIAWTYGTLLYVEGAAAQPAEAGPAAEEPIEVTIVGFQFGWRFVYTDVPGHADGVTTTGELWLPEDRMIRLTVTASDVWHNFGVPELRVKSDAIPGQNTTTWVKPEDTGTYTARCYELCGAGHSAMHATVEVSEPGEFEEWYGEQAADQNLTAEAA